MENNQYNASMKQDADSEIPKIDLLYYMDITWKKVKRLWWLPFLLAVMGFAYTMLRFDYTFTPYYTTSITAYVEMASDSRDSYQDQLTASQMEKVFPYLMSNGLLQDAILSKLDMDSLPGSISMSVDQYTNLLTFVATGADPKDIHKMLLTTVEVFPQTLSYIVGPTRFRTFKDMGVPKEPSNSPPSVRTAIYQSARKGGYMFGIGLILIIIFGALNQTIGTNKQLKEVVNAPLLGIIPVARRTRKRLYALIDDDKTSANFLEAVRSFRTRVERECKEDNQVFMVTSTLPGEGKSTIAVNLALSLAAKKRKILLIDCDMRNPSVAGILSIEETPGLYEVLAGEVSLEAAIRYLPQQELYVMPAGARTRQSSEMLNHPRMEEMLSQVSRFADYVILDTPPVNVLSDSKVLARSVNGCIYVVRKDTARYQAVQEGVMQITETGGRILGTVFNGSEGEEGGYSRSGKYGGYGKYGKYGKYGIYGKNRGYGDYGSYEEKK